MPRRRDGASAAAGGAPPPARALALLALVAAAALAAALAAAGGAAAAVVTARRRFLADVVDAAGADPAAAAAAASASGAAAPRDAALLAEQARERGAAGAQAPRRLRGGERRRRRAADADADAASPSSTTPEQASSFTTSTTALALRMRAAREHRRRRADGVPASATTTTTSPTTSPTPLGTADRGAKVTVSSSALPPNVRAVAVGCGKWFTCTVMADGAGWCFGSNTYSQLGDGTTQDRWTPVRVQANYLVDVSAGLTHACFLDVNGNVWCQGTNYAGESGPTNACNLCTVTTATMIPNLQAKKVFAGNQYTCVIQLDDTLACFGSNTYFTTAILSPGATMPSPVIKPFVFSMLGSVRTAALGQKHMCAVTASNALYCWGFNSQSQLPLSGGVIWRPTLVEGVSALAVGAGAYHTCVVTTAGTSMCVGRNWYGEAGDPSGALTTSLTAVPNVPPAVGLATGDSINMARASDGTLTMWGQNTGVAGIGTLSGGSQNGVGSMQGGVTATTVAPGPGGPGALYAASHSVGSTHACLIQAGSGALYCAGDAQKGALGAFYPSSQTYYVRVVVPIGGSSGADLTTSPTPSPTKRAKPGKGGKGGNKAPSSTSPTPAPTLPYVGPGDACDGGVTVNCEGDLTCSVTTASCVDAGACGQACQARTPGQCVTSLVASVPGCACTLVGAVRQKTCVAAP